MTELIFVVRVPGMKVNGQYYRNVLLSQRMLPAIKHVASDTLSFNKTTLHLIVEAQLNSYSKKQQETPDFVGYALWPPNSPDLNVWVVM